MGLSLEQVKPIHSNMISQFNQCPPNEAKKQGEEWFHSIQEETINLKKNNSLKSQM